jgi:hypothetical protein
MMKIFWDRRFHNCFRARLCYMKVITCSW